MQASHKKTFFYLEQLILKHSAHNNTVRVKQESGIDLSFFVRRRKKDKCKIAGITCIANIEFEIYINPSRPKDLELNSPNMSERKPMNDVERICSLTNFSPNKRSPANFSLLHYL